MQHTSILITGASRGIGAALARAYAKPHVHLALVGRHAERLHQISEKCRRQGAHVSEKVLDIQSFEPLNIWIQDIDQKFPLSLVIANAGRGTQGCPETTENTLDIFATNVQGTLHTVLSIIPLMKSRGFGQIAIMSSLASFRGFAEKSAYCGSKAALRIYGEGLRDSLKPFGIQVSVICPGFVKTALTDFNNFKMPFVMAPEKAAKIIQRGLEKNQGRIAFPWPTYLSSLLLSWMPTLWAEFFARQLPYKKKV